MNMKQMNMKLADKHLYAEFDGDEQSRDNAWQVPSLLSSSVVATTLILPFAVQQTSHRLAEFFILRLGAEFIQQNPQEGTMELRVNHSIGFADVKVRLYTYQPSEEAIQDKHATETLAVVVFLPSNNARLCDFSAIYQAAKDFFQNQREHSLTAQRGCEDLENVSTDDEWENEDENMESDSESDLTDAYVPTYDEWELLCDNTDPTSDDELRSFRDMILAYDAKEQTNEAKPSKCFFAPLVDVLVHNRAFVQNAFQSPQTCHIMSSIIEFLGMQDGDSASLLLLCDIAQLCLDSEDSDQRSTASSRASSLARVVYNIVGYAQEKLSADMRAQLVCMLQPCLNDTRVIDENTRRYVRSTLCTLQDLV